MSDTVRAEEPADLTEPNGPDSPPLGHEPPPYECEGSRPPWSRAATLRLVLVGLASGLIVVGLAVALME
ncbi:hypothetical protein [Streptomyces sp. NPDC002790]|uniref:hypothetical protein n=1 Tax=Streptomyces sp. NPDC002790 TaxID=3154431 RepID=UPI00332AB749